MKKNPPSPKRVRRIDWQRPEFNRVIPAISRDQPPAAACCFEMFLLSQLLATE